MNNSIPTEYNIISILGHIYIYIKTRVAPTVKNTFLINITLFLNCSVKKSVMENLENVYSF